MKISLQGCYIEREQASDTMIVSSFIDPVTKGTLVRAVNGNLCCSGQIYKCHNDIYDFVPEGTQLWQEREYYDKQYVQRKPYELTEAKLRNEWQSEIYPEITMLFDSLGELNNKRILCVGNGNSWRELYFILQGAKVVLTDLSLAAIKNLKRDFSDSCLYDKYKDMVEFHTVDALNLPFADGEFDIIYGAAFVHHIQDNISQFFSEVNRCLKKDGKCRFSDQAYSTTWNLLKKIAYPLKAYSYRKQPRSQGDLRARDFTIEEISKIKGAYGFREIFWHREWFFLKIVSRHYGKLVDWNPKAIQRVRPLYLMCKSIDKKLERTRWMQSNALVLIWGFNK